MRASINIGTSFEHDVQTSVHLPQDNRVLGAVFMLDNVLLPLLRNEMSLEMNKRESKLRSSLHLNYAKKFASRVCKFVDCNERGVKFVVPKYLENFGMQRKAPEESCNKGQDTIENVSKIDMNPFDRLVSQWNDILVQTLDSEAREQPRNNLPMGEVDFWRRRHVFLSDIVEQLSSPSVQFVFSMCQKSEECPLLFSNIQKNINTVMQLAVEAADNSKFLSTLERHLRTIQDGSLPSMITALPSLVDGIRMIWCVSQYYCRKDRVFPLMKKIASQIASRVSCLLHISEFAKDNSLSLLKERVGQSKILLESWKTANKQAREYMEKSGKNNSQWEFEAEPLFRHTDYMANVCNDIIFVIDSLDNYKIFQCSEMLDVVDEDDENINQILCLVNSLKRKVLLCDYDIFDVGNEWKWQETISIFPVTMAFIKKQAEMYLEKAFQNIRYSEKAHELVMKLKGTLLNCRHDDIFQRYEIELKQARRCYKEKYKITPPLCWRYAVNPGRVAAINDVYRRVKKPMLLFKSHGTIASCLYGKKIRQQFVEFSKDVDLFKSCSYAGWTQTVNSVCRDVLHSPVLMKLTTTVGDASKSFIEINFPCEVRSLISEGKRFASFGYIIPESLSQVILLQPLLDSYLPDLEQLVGTYNALRNEISSIETAMLRGHLDRLDRIVLAGLRSVNWSSQSVQSYINEAETAVVTFQNALTKTRKYSASITKILIALAKKSLVSQNHVSTSSTLDHVNGIIDENIIDIEQMCDMICSLVTKIDVICNSSSETVDNLSAPFALEIFHKYWGMKLYNSLCSILIRSVIETFLNSILAEKKPKDVAVDKEYSQSIRTIKQVVKTMLQVISSKMTSDRFKKSWHCFLENDPSHNSIPFILTANIIEQHERIHKYYYSEQ